MFWWLFHMVDYVNWYDEYVSCGYVSIGMISMLQVVDCHLYWYDEQVSHGWLSFGMLSMSHMIMSLVLVQWSCLMWLCHLYWYDEHVSCGYVNCIGMFHVVDCVSYIGMIHYQIFSSFLFLHSWIIATARYMRCKTCSKLKSGG